MNWIQRILARMGVPVGASLAVDVANVKAETALIKTQTDKIAGKMLFSMDFWSALREEILVTGAQTTPIPPPVVVEDLPGDAVIVRAIVMMKFRMVENDYAGENKLDAAAVLPMQVDDGVTGMLTCIDFVDEAFTLAEATREGGDVIIGDIDVAARVDGNDTYDFQWLNAKALQNNLRFNDVQMGIRIWYSV